MSTAAEVKGALQAHLHQYLAKVHFDRFDMCFGNKLSPDAWGCLEISSNFDACSGQLRTDVAVGVRHDPLERLVARLKGTISEGLIPFSIGTQIGYLMPARTHISYVLNELASAEKQAARIASDVSRYGLSFMKAHTTIDDIVREMTAVPSRTPTASVAYRLPVAEILRNDPRSALRVYSSFKEKFATKNDAWFKAYSSFGYALETFIAANPV